MEIDRMDLVVWQDRDVKFDIYNVLVELKICFYRIKIVDFIFDSNNNIHCHLLTRTWFYRQNKIRGGEEILDIFDYVEDTKGNPNERGRLLVTNLRLVWYSLNNNKFNLCMYLFCKEKIENKWNSRKKLYWMKSFCWTAIGYNCILTMSTKTVLSKLRGTTLALYILTLCRNSRFEFIFTNLAQSNARKFTSVFDVYRSYQATVLYRELKLRSAIMASGHLKLLPKEQVYSTFGGIWNLSSDQGNLGTLIATNIRVIWYADINETFNISLPHMQISTVNLSK